MSIFTCVAAIRGSVCSVAVSGGGQGFPASHVRRERLAVSLARRKLKAVEPVRGSPSPNSGATISCSSISGCRAYHCSTSSRFTRRLTIWSVMTLSPNSLSADSLVSGVHQNIEALSPGLPAEVIRPRPVTAVSTSCSTCIPMAPCPPPADCAATTEDITGPHPSFPNSRLRGAFPGPTEGRRARSDANPLIGEPWRRWEMPDGLVGDVPDPERSSTDGSHVAGSAAKSCRNSRSSDLQEIEGGSFRLQERFVSGHNQMPPSSSVHRTGSAGALSHPTSVDRATRRRRRRPRSQGASRFQTYAALTDIPCPPLRRRPVRDGTNTHAREAENGTPHRRCALTDASDPLPPCSGTARKPVDTYCSGLRFPSSAMEDSTSLSAAVSGGWTMPLGQRCRTRTTLSSEAYRVTWAAR